MLIAESRVLHRSLRDDLPVAARGDGVRLYDMEGREYLDACGGAAVSCLGHSHPAPIAAIRRQAETLAYAHTAFFTSETAERLAEALLARAPKRFANGRVMFLNSGSEANEAALKLARQYHLELGRKERGKVIARDFAYHGATLGALSAGGHKARRATYAPMLLEVGRIPACYAYRGRAEGETEPAYGRRVADALESEILRLGPENTAAFIAEPVSGATLGAVPPVKGYFRRIREICDSYDVVLIADEVMCGSGRTGTFFALDQEEVEADIIVIAKGLGAGLQPIAAVIASGRIVAALEQGSGALAHGQTYMAHPMVCAAALAVLETIDRDNLLDNVRGRGEQLDALLRARLGQHPHVGDIRGRGLFRGVEFVRHLESKTPFPDEAKLAQKLKAAAMARGLMVYPASGCVDGFSGDHALLAPPYIINPSEIEIVVERFGEAIDAALREVQSAL